AAFLKKNDEIGAAIARLAEKESGKDKARLANKPEHLWGTPQGRERGRTHLGEPGQPRGAASCSFALRHGCRQCQETTHALRQTALVDCNLALVAVVQDLEQKSQESRVPGRHVQGLEGELPDLRGGVELRLDLG